MFGIKVNCLTNYLSMDTIFYRRSFVIDQCVPKAEEETTSIIRG